MKSHLPNEAVLSIHNSGRLFTEYRQLVYQTYAKRGWVNTNDYPSGLAQDEFDSHSNSLIIHKDTSVIAGMRIVHHSLLNLPHQKLLQLERLKRSVQLLEKYPMIISAPQERVAEITMVAGNSHMQSMLFNIAKGLFWYAKRFNIAYYLMVVDFDFFRMCDRIGIPMHPYGIPFRYDGSWTLPALTIPGEYPDAISHEKWGRAYLTDPNNLDQTWKWTFINPDTNSSPTGAL